MQVPPQQNPPAPLGHGVLSGLLVQSPQLRTNSESMSCWKQNFPGSQATPQAPQF
jgi:hypothetical protein